MRSIPDAGDEGLPLTQASLSEAPLTQGLLTEAERGIWLGQQLNPGSPFYNAAEVIDIKGALNASAFGAALRQALEEAPAFHRVFRQTADGARQFPDAPQPNFVVLDFSFEAQPEQAAEDWMRKDLAQPVDLTQGPLYQQALIKLAEEHHLWYQRIHHIAADGFAFALLSQRVAELHNSRVEKRDAGKPFGDYAVVLEDDQRYQTSQRCNVSRDFWLSRLEQSPRPVSFSRSLAPIEQWPLHLSTVISEGDFSCLKDFAQSLRCNWADAITAAVACLVHKHTAAPEITLGLPVMGRMGTPALRVPAMVMNITPLHVSAPSTPLFGDWVKQVADEQKHCRPHQRYRYEHLRRDLNAVGGDKRLYGPVVNIMPFDRQLRFGNATGQVRNLSAGPVEDISFAFILQPDNSLRFDLEANPGRYSEQQLAEYQQEMISLLKNPFAKKPVQVSPELFAWLQGDELQHPLPSVLELFAEQVRERPGATALVDGDEHLTYAALYEKARRFAAGLKTRYIQTGDVVALSLPRGEAAVVSCVGCLLAGATYIFLDPKGPEARNQRILQDAGPKLIVSQEADPDNCSLTTAGYAALQSAAPISEADWRQVSEDELAYLIYTSGSTGTPKGVMVGRRALAEFVAGAAQAYAIDEKDRVLQYAPLHFDASVEEIFVTLCQGGTLVIRSESMLDSVAQFLNTCEEWRISVLDLPTAYWHELVYFCHSTGTRIPESIHTVIIGGEAALPERVRQWHQLDTQGIRLLNTYGPSETTVVASYARLQADEPVSIGAPLPGRQLAVVDKQGRIVKRGETGELVVLGGGIGFGYRNMPEVTASRFRELQFPWQKKQWAYFTGDKALVTAEGTVEYQGRLDAEIKISGHRINPVEIESAILSLNVVREVAVVPGGNGEQKCLTAFVVPIDETHDLSVQTLRQQLAELLPAPMLPTRVETLQQLPQSAAGKVDRKALAELTARGAETAEQGDLSAEEQLVIEVWQQVLDSSAIGPDDDFFMRGGQSLQTIQVANRLSAALRRDVAVTLLFEHPTVRQLASALNQGSAVQKAVSVKDAVEADIARFKVELSPARDPQVKPLEECKNILLTGATGFVGAQLLHQLLHSSSATVTCLVRAETVEHAREKIEQALLKQRLVVHNLHEKIRVVLANLEQPQLGLKEEEFEALAEQVDAVFHNAAITSVMRDYNSLRAANLLSTQTLLQLAAMKGAPFHLVSTIAVAPASGLPENFVGWHKGLQDGYQQTKWVAERSAQVAADLGYPVSVYRLARVVGDLDSAAVNDKDLVWNIVAASVRNGVFPRLPIQEPWTPVDVVTRAIVAFAQQPCEQHVINIVPPSAIALQDVGQWLRDAGFDLESVPVKEWCERLAKSAHEQDRAILGFFQQRQSPSTNEVPTEMALPVIQDEHTQQFLNSRNIHLPEITQQHFNAYLREAIHKGLVSPPVSKALDKRGTYEPA